MKIPTNFLMSEYEFEQFLKHLYKEKSIPAEELTAKIKECEENLQQSDNTVLENGHLSMKHQREMTKLSEYTSLLATLVNYMSKVSLKEAEKPVAGV